MRTIMVNNIHKRNRIAPLLERVLLLLFFAVSYFTVSGQQSYPVHVGVQVLPPYSLYLADYYGGSRDRLVVTLLNRDQQQQSLNVRLRVKITNNAGFTLQSREEVPFPMLVLESGIPQRLTNTDIAPYLIPANTTMQGYLNEGRLPTGMTEFSFQAVDYTTGRALSAWATGRVWLETKKPPLLNVPQKDEEVAQMQPQFVRFGWMPQHQGLAVTEYEFVLKELPDNGVAPQSAFMYGQEIFRTTTRFTTLDLTPLDPELIPGRRYGWQVRAIARDGLDEVGMFENNGFSEIGWFNLNERCPAPMQVQAEGGYRKMTLSWTQLAGQQAFMVQYRPKSEHGLYEWSAIRTFDNRITVHDLKPGWRYEYRVGALCTTERAVYSQLQEITLAMDNEERLAQCGIVPDVDIENQTPNEELRAGDQVFVGGDFPMTVTQASHQGSGWYSGKGRLTVPWVFETTIAVRFDRLRVNTDNRQIGGEVESETDPDASQIADLNELDYGGNRTTPAGVVFVERTVDFTIPPMPEASFDEETGELTVYDVNGTPHIVPTEKNADGETVFPMIITDKEGNRYRVDVPEDTSDGSQDGGTETGTPGAAGEKGQKQVVMTKIETLTGTFDTSQLSKNPPVTVRFVKGAGKYALDEGTESRYKRSVMLSKYYEAFGTDYVAPWKLVPTGKSDVVEAIAIENGAPFERGKLRFALKDGTEIPASDEEGKWTLTLPGVGKAETYEVFALYETTTGKYATVGKLNVVSYPEQRHTVTLVEVDGQAPQAASLQERLNAIYNPYGVNFTVQTDNILKGNTSWDLDGDGKLDVSGSGFFTNETAEMKALRKLYRDTPGSQYEKNAYYLFLLKSADASGEPDEPQAVQGDMPRGKQFGYLFTSSAEDIGRLAAHELGHGIFTLPHTFDVNLLGSDSKGQTANLMDYGDVTELAVWQWNVMANPAPMTWFDDDEDAMSFLTIIDQKHTHLFDHVFKENLSPYNISNMTAYKNALWSKPWNYFGDKQQETIDEVIVTLKEAVVDNTVPAMALQEQGIYIGKHQIGDNEYTTAIYSRKAEISNIKKISVLEKKDLATENVKKHLSCDEHSLSKYVVLAFYEEGDNEPVLMIQVVRNDLFKLNASYLEEWMHYLGMLDTLQLFNNNTRIVENSIVLISAVPEMPRIRIKTSAALGKEIDLRLTITYQRDGINPNRGVITNVRDDIDHYPLDGWKKIKAGETWDVNFGQDIRGGTAELSYRIDDRTYTTKFYIRGTNPTEAQIRNYLNSRGYLSRYWFVVRMTRQESSMRQFGNTGAHITTRLNGSTNALGEPLYGYPRGFGLKQLDNWGNPTRYAEAQHLWNWQANIEGGIEVIREKRATVEAYRTRYERIISDWDDDNPDDKVGTDLSIKTGVNTHEVVDSVSEGNITFAVDPEGDQKDIHDALWIQLFNGGDRYYEVIQTDREIKPIREIKRNNTQNGNYVNTVCSRND